MILLHLDTIKKNLKDKNIDISILETIPSTNHYLKSLQHFKKPYFCFAEQQTQGKGRFNREWYSPFGKNIYLSFFYPFKKDLSALSGLSLLISLTVRRTLESLGIKDNLFVKWSNDVMYQDKKISGNLIEVQSDHSPRRLIMGIGINVNMLDDENVISQQWTSMQKILNTYIDRNLVCSTLINNLLVDCQRFEKNSFSTFMQEWAQYDYLLNQVITLKNGDHTWVGRVKGVNVQGHLLLELTNGEMRAFSAGEVINH